MDVILNLRNESKIILHTHQKTPNTLFIYINDNNDNHWFFSYKNNDELPKTLNKYKNIVFYGPVKNLPDNFLNNITEVKKFIFRLPNLEKVENNWMKNCTNLEKVDFTDLNKLKSVGNDWMKNCKKLETVNFIGLNKLKRVGDNWMENCENLETVDFIGLSSLESDSVGRYWMYNSDLYTGIYHEIFKNTNSTTTSIQNRLIEIKKEITDAKRVRE